MLKKCLARIRKHKLLSIAFAGVLLVIGLIAFPCLYSMVQNRNGPSLVIDAIGDCPAARAVVGPPPFEIGYNKGVATAGAWNPPGPGYTGKMLVRGSMGTAVVYYSSGAAAMTFYPDAYSPVRQKQAAREVDDVSNPERVIIDLVTCSRETGE